MAGKTDEKPKADQHPIKYGMGNDASFKPKGDKTEPQEYKKDGLPKMDKYSVDKK